MRASKVPQATAVRERILSFARERFLSNGFSKISVDEISSDLVISKKTFYKFFTSKEHLLEQIMDAVMSDVDGNFSRVLGSRKNFVEKLHDVMTFLALELSKFSKTFQHDVQRHAPGVWNRIQDFRRQQIMKNFGRLLEQGIREGFVRKEINRRVFLLAYLGAVESIVTPAVLANESFSAQEALKSIMGIYFRGVLTDDATRYLDRLQSDHHSYPT